MASPQQQPSNFGEFRFDAAYLRRLRARDVATLSHFTDFFYQPLRNKIRHNSGSEVVEDLVQDVFVVALSRIDAGEPQDPKKLPGYMFGICHNVILREWDTTRRPKTVDFDLSLFADAKERADALMFKQFNARLVRGILSKMPARECDALRREFFLQQDRSVAAREMGVTQDNFRTILCRALKRFRSYWDNLQ